jgi:hypothetical protein
MLMTVGSDAAGISGRGVGGREPVWYQEEEEEVTPIPELTTSAIAYCAWWSVFCMCVVQQLAQMSMAARNIERAV